MLKRQRRKLMLKWRLAQLGVSDASAEQLLESLTVEGLRSKDTPSEHEVAVIEFRRLRTDARLAACRAFLKDRGNTWPF